MHIHSSKKKTEIIQHVDSSLQTTEKSENDGTPSYNVNPITDQMLTGAVTKIMPKT